MIEINVHNPQSYLFGCESLSNGFDEVNGVKILISAWIIGVVTADGEILSHFSVFDCLDGSIF